MQVFIKEFNVDMEVKSKGIEFGVCKPDGSKHIGDCFLTMIGLVWCKGRKGRREGIIILWEDFMEIMKSKEAKKAALKAAKSV